MKRSRALQKAINDDSKSNALRVCLLLVFLQQSTIAFAEQQVPVHSNSISTMNQPEQGQRPIVIVHGAWGGAHHWKKVAQGLQHHGEEVHRVTLTGLGERSHLSSPKVTLSTHIQDIVKAIEFEDLNAVVLVGHSYGGVVVSGVADLIPDRISKRIYIDSHVLDSGESYLTHHPEEREKYMKRAKDDGGGWLIPVDWPNPFQDVPHPLATLTQPLILQNAARETIPASYWLLADGQPPEQDERYCYFQRSLERGWDVQTFSWGHNPQRERPDEVAKELLKALH